MGVLGRANLRNDIRTLFDLTKELYFSSKVKTCSYAILKNNSQQGPSQILGRVSQRHRTRFGLRWLCSRQNWLSEPIRPNSKYMKAHAIRIHDSVCTGRSSFAIGQFVRMENMPWYATIFLRQSTSLAPGSHCMQTIHCVRKGFPSPCLIQFFLAWVCKPLRFHHCASRRSGPSLSGWCTRRSSTRGEHSVPQAQRTYTWVHYVNQFCSPWRQIFLMRIVSKAWLYPHYIW